SGVGKPHMEPTTDKYEVQLLNTLLQDVLSRFLYTRDCDDMITIEPVVGQPFNSLGLKIIPNHAHGKFAIEVKNPVKDLFITDFAGKILLRLPAPDTKGIIQVDMRAYPAGVYLVR